MLSLRDQGISIADAIVKAMLSSYPETEHRLEILKGARDLLVLKVKEIKEDG